MACAPIIEINNKKNNFFFFRFEKRFVRSKKKVRHTDSRIILCIQNTLYMYIVINHIYLRTDLSFIVQYIPILYLYVYNV